MQAPELHEGPIETHPLWGVVVILAEIATRMANESAAKDPSPGVDPEPPAVGTNRAAASPRVEEAA